MKCEKIVFRCIIEIQDNVKAVANSKAQTVIGWLLMQSKIKFFEDSYQ